MHSSRSVTELRQCSSSISGCFCLCSRVYTRDGQYNTTIIDTTDTDTSSCSINTWLLAIPIRYFAHVVYFGVPGTCGISVSSEKLISKAGEVVTARRRNIKPKNVDMISLFKQKLIMVFGGGGQYPIVSYHIVSVYHVNTQYCIESPLPGIAHL